MSQNAPNSQSTLRANKEVFFFRLVCAARQQGDCFELTGCSQEREIEKVNAFYLQKEAEVWPHHLVLPTTAMLTTLKVFPAIENIG